MSQSKKSCTYDNGSYVIYISKPHVHMLAVFFSLYFYATLIYVLYFETYTDIHVTDLMEPW